MPSFEGNLLTQWHQITSLETRNSRLSYGENPSVSLSDLGLIRYRVVTPGQTDGRVGKIRRPIMAYYGTAGRTVRVKAKNNAGVLYIAVAANMKLIQKRRTGCQSMVSV